jgi:hypothetical protein
MKKRDGFPSAAEPTKLVEFARNVLSNGEQDDYELTLSSAKVLARAVLDLLTIDQPPHYKPGEIEMISVVEAWGLNFHLGNVIKYVARVERKGMPLDDLKKARWYLDREIARRKAESR